MAVPYGQEAHVSALRKELGSLVDLRNWEFVYGAPEQIRELFESLQTDLELNATGGTPYVFVIDKERKLRGRKADEDIGTKYGFNTSSVADLNNKMKDDVKIILAEYRMALKKNQAVRD
jgi:hypothetical protein